MFEAQHDLTVIDHAKKYSITNFCSSCNNNSKNSLNNINKNNNKYKNNKNKINNNNNNINNNIKHNNNASNKNNINNHNWIAITLKTKTIEKTVHTQIHLKVEGKYKGKLQVLHCLLIQYALLDPTRVKPFQRDHTQRHNVGK